MGTETVACQTTIDLTKCYDVLVVGGGNAALCAAMTAREAGASVLLLESSPFEFRGGNSRHTRNLRYLHESGNSFLTGPYLEEEFFDDLMRQRPAHQSPASRSAGSPAASRRWQPVQPPRGSSAAPALPWQGRGKSSSSRTSTSTWAISATGRSPHGTCGSRHSDRSSPSPVCSGSVSCSARPWSSAGLAGSQPPTAAC